MFWFCEDGSIRAEFYLRNVLILKQLFRLCFVSFHYFDSKKILPFVLF